MFHDFVVDWKPGGEATDVNIDHIAVGPDGIFAFETKVRRKPLDQGKGGEKQYKVGFDGKKLHFPGYSTAGPIDQAKSNARTLQDWLNGTVASPVSVRPVVVIPGWWLEVGDDWLRSGVQRAKGLADRVPGLGRGRRLTAEEVRQIAGRLEAHCRNVEGA